MTGCGKPKKTAFHNLGNRCRDSHIPTAPATAILVPRNQPERSLPQPPRSQASPGSFFDWKRLYNEKIRVLPEEVHPETQKADEPVIRLPLKSRVEQIQAD